MKKARETLQQLRKNAVVGDVISPVGESRMGSKAEWGQFFILDSAAKPPGFEIEKT
jgi:hypothetical protein